MWATGSTKVCAWASVLRTQKVCLGYGRRPRCMVTAVCLQQGDRESKLAVQGLLNTELKATEA